MALDGEFLRIWRSKVYQWKPDEKASRKSHLLGRNRDDTIMSNV